MLYSGKKIRDKKQKILTLINGAPVLHTDVWFSYRGG